MTLERGWRGALLVSAVAMLLIGVPAFVAPAWAVEQFPWKVGPFLAQTIGAWCVGAGAICALLPRVARDGRVAVDRVFAMLVFLWLFGALELIVVLAFAGKLQWGHLLTWPYLVGLAGLVAAAVLGVVDIAQRRPDLRGPAGTHPRWMRAIEAAFVGFVALLALGNLVSGDGGVVMQGRFFPEEMTLFSVRAFAAFFGALAISAALLLPARNPRPVYEFNRLGILVVVPITLAALLNLPLFDFAGVPGGALYLAAYLLVAVAAPLFVAWSQRNLGVFPEGEVPGRLY